MSQLRHPSQPNTCTWQRIFAVAVCASLLTGGGTTGRPSRCLPCTCTFTSHLCSPTHHGSHLLTNSKQVFSFAYDVSVVRSTVPPSASSPVVVHAADHPGTGTHGVWINAFARRHEAFAQHLSHIRRYEVLTHQTVLSCKDSRYSAVPAVLAS
jgi:hypothetical protein